MGLDSLVKLKLDNNKIYELTNLDQLVNLQWLGARFQKKKRRQLASTSLRWLRCLVCCYPTVPRIFLNGRLAVPTDLSFNNIEKIQGLDKLTELTDLSLFNNVISELEGLDTLQKLSALSVGNNQIAALDSVMCKYHPLPL